MAKCNQLTHLPLKGLTATCNDSIANYILCLKSDTDVAHYNLDADQPILIILAQMLLREYATKR